MQNENEPSVEDILRSIKRVISRDDEKSAQGGSIPNFGASRPFAQRESYSGGFAPVPPVAANAIDPQPAAQDDGDVYDLSNLSAVPVAEEDVPPVALPAAFAAAENLNEEPAEQSDDDGAAPEEEDTPSPIEITLGARDEEREEPSAAPVEEPAPEPAAFTRPEPVAPPAPQSSPAADEGLIAGATVAAMRDRIAALTNLSAAAPKAEAAANPLEEVVRDMLRPMLKEWLDDNLQGIIENMVEAEIARITGRR